MTHEFIHIVKQALKHQVANEKMVLATVVKLDGSSYRKPGVRMLISENRVMTGAISGGCVEKEVLRRASSVFETKVPKVITYDGRYRLGCEGVLYILLEPFSITNDLNSQFNLAIQHREYFEIESFFTNQDETIGNFGSVIRFKNGSEFNFKNNYELEKNEETLSFKQVLSPLFRLIIVGGEHDAVQLCQAASLLGWEIEVITSAKEDKISDHFPGATYFKASSPELIEFNTDTETAIVLMNHNYVSDLKYLIKLVAFPVRYIGIIGSIKRREQLFNELFHYVPNLNEDFLNTIYSPAGLNIGAVTPEEIAFSVVSEILSIYRKKRVNSVNAASLTPNTK